MIECLSAAETGFNSKFNFFTKNYYPFLCTAHKYIPEKYAHKTQTSPRVSWGNKDSWSEWISFVHSNKTLHEVAAYLKLLPSPDDVGVENNREFLLEMLVRYCQLLLKLPITLEKRSESKRKAIIIAANLITYTALWNFCRCPDTNGAYHRLMPLMKCRFIQ